MRQSILACWCPKVVDAACGRKSCKTEAKREAASLAHHVPIESSGLLNIVDLRSRSFHAYPVSTGWHDSTGLFINVLLQQPL
jgi:hypothetical protein